MEKIAISARQDVVIPGDRQATIAYAADHFVTTAKQAIAEREAFYVALSGGSTPKAIFQKLSKESLDWSKVWLFWSDERHVPLDDPESNFLMAMEAGFKHFPIPKEQIFPMITEGDIESFALKYEHQILTHVPEGEFDLIMLGMGSDAHTASLFPQTHALHTQGRFVTANFIPSKSVWRMTMTFDCIHQARTVVLYVLGEDKAGTIHEVFYADFDPELRPVQNVGTPEIKGLWILDHAAAKYLNQKT